VYLNVTDVLKG